MSSPRTEAPTDPTAASLERVASEIGRRLRSRGESLAVAESCTGGLIAATLTGIPGSSVFFWGSAVVYTAAAKRELTGLREKTLRTDGTVSAATSEGLATAIRARSQATYGAAVTGWAGPTAGPGGEVGRVFGALAGSEGVLSREWRFDGERDDVRRMAAAAVLGLLRERIDEKQDVADDAPGSGNPGRDETGASDS